MSERENEQLVRAFYESTAPGHRERLRAIQSPHVVYDLPEGMPVASGHFEGLEDVLERFLAAEPDLRIEDARPYLPQPARALVDDRGILRTFPHRDGLDGFFAVRLKRETDSNMVRP